MMIRKWKRRNVVTMVVLLAMISGMMFPSSVGVQAAPAKRELGAPSDNVVLNAESFRLLKYDRSNSSYSNAGNSGGASIILALASLSGDSQADVRLLEQIRYTLTGGNDIVANGGYPAQHELQATGMLAIAKQTPRVWDQLSVDERQRADAMMKASLISSTFTTSDNNPFILSGSPQRALDGDSNLGRDWNPNYREGMVGSVIVASAYFGVTEAESILQNYDHEQFVRQLEDLGLTNAHQTFNWQTANPGSPAPMGSQIEDAVKDWSLHSVKLNETMQLYLDLTNYTYGRTVNCGLNDGQGIEGISQAPDGIAGVIDSGCENLPNLGKEGMLLEFDAADGPGLRSSITYAYSGIKPNLITQSVLIVTDLWETNSETEALLSRMIVGMEDFWYKLAHGYRDYSNGKYHGIFNSRTPNFGFDYVFSIWDDVIRPYHGHISFPDYRKTNNVARDATVEVSSSVTSSDWQKENLNDGIRDSVAGSGGWNSGDDITNDHTEWVQFLLSDVNSIDRIILYPRNSNPGAGFNFPIDFTIEVSTDGVNWDNVVSETDYPGSTTAQEFEFDPVDALLVRITGTKLRPAPTTGAYRLAFAEIEIYKSGPAPITNIHVTGDNEATSVQVGQTLQMIAEVAPENADDTAVLWSITGGTGQAQIDGMTGLLTAQKAGTVTVVASANDGSGVTGHAVITIEENNNVARDATIEVSSSVSTNGWQKENLNDGIRDSVEGSWGWNSGDDITNDHTEWVQFLLSDVNSIDRIILYPRNSNPGAGFNFPIDFTIEVSTDGVNWDNVVSETDYPGSTTAQEFEFDPVDALLVRITGTKLRPAPTTGAYRLAFAEIEIYKAESSEAEPVSVTNIRVIGDNEATSVQVGQTLQMIAEVAPENADDTAVLWSITGGTGQAQIDEMTGLLTAQKAGTVTVVASANDGSGVTGQADITIVPLPSTGSYVPPSGPKLQNCSIDSACELTIDYGLDSKLTIDGLLEITIPAYARNEAWSIKVDKLEEEQAELLAVQLNKRRISPVFDLYSDKGDQLLKPLVLEFDIEEEQDQAEFPAVYVYDEAAKQWNKLGGTLNEVGDRISVEVEHLAKFAVFVAEAEEPESGSEPVLTDIAAHWAENAITRAQAAGFVSGYPDTTFRPDANISREEFVHMLVSALALHGESSELFFDDAGRIGSWSYRSIAIAVEQGVISGYEDGSFRPKESINRVEMMTIIVRALGLPTHEGAELAFADAGSIPSWAKEYVAAALESGLVTGRDGNRFAPNESGTRAEAVTIIIRILDSIHQ